MKHNYEILFFIENKKITEFLRKLDICDKHKSFGKWIQLSITTSKILTEEWIKELVKTLQGKDDGDIGIIFVNNEVIFKNEKYYSLSDGRWEMFINTIID